MSPEIEGSPGLSGLSTSISADGQWRRLSGRMLLIHPVREVGRFIPALAGVFFLGNKGGEGHWWSLALLGVVLLISVVRWATTSFRITPAQIQLRSGLLRKRIIAAPSDRVRTVDVTEHALHRVLGLAKVTIGTGSSDHKREGLVLDGLAIDEARSLRAELLHREQRAEASDPVPGEFGPRVTRPQRRRLGPWRQSHSYPLEARGGEDGMLQFQPAWIRFAPFTFSGAVTALAIVGFAWNILQQSQIDAGHLGAIQSASRHLRDSPLWMSVVEVGIGIVLATSLLSSAGYALAFWNFRLLRHSGGTLQVSRGLITTRTTSIEHRRLRGIEVSEPVLLRAVGGARLFAIATGLRVGRGAERGGAVLAPPAPAEVVYRLAEAVLDDPRAAAAIRAPLKSHGPLALRRRLIRASGLWLVLSVGLVALWLDASWPAWPALIALAGLAGSPFLALDRYRSLGHGATDGYLVSRFGSLVRRRIALHSDGIIGWNERQSPFQRRLGLVTLEVTSAAGRQRYRITDVMEGEAISIAQQLTPGLLDQFLEPVNDPR